MPMSISVRGAGRAALCAVLASMMLAAIGDPSRAGAVGSDLKPFTASTPTVSAEVPWTNTSTPFGADGVYPEFPLPRGYVEREYFISGTASIYEFSPHGVRVVAPCPAAVTGSELPACSGLPYTTRILVAAPRDPRRFSGDVWVNPLNPTAGYDYREEWNRSHSYHVARGDAYVMWTSKSTAVATLKQVDPGRYAALSWPYTPSVPGANNAPYDGITYDVAAQLGALLKRNGKTSPLHAYRVKYVFETGFSQDGCFTFNQASVFHRLERLRGGGRIYDGYVPQGCRGTGDINFGLTPAGSLPSGDPRIKMQPRDAPVLKVNTETELAGFTSSPGIAIDWRRPDSDAPADRYREWEVPGSSHDDVLTASDPTSITLYGQASFPVDCAHSGPPNVSPTDFPYVYVANAAFSAMAKWVKRGTPPAHVQPIQQTNLVSPSRESIVRDRFGNARGGVRTPLLDVPHSTYNVIDEGSSFCWSVGWRTPLSDTVLHSLYRSHRDYVRKFTSSAWDAVRRGVWLPGDARDAIQSVRRDQVR